MLTFDSGFSISDALVKVSEADIKKFQTFAERQISRGKVERLSKKGTKQAIENLAWHIFILAYAGNIDPVQKEMDKETYLSQQSIKQQTDELDKVSEVVAIASTIHPTILESLVDVRVNEYIEQLFAGR